MLRGLECWGGPWNYFPRTLAITLGDTPRNDLGIPGAEKMLSVTMYKCPDRVWAPTRSVIIRGEGQYLH